MNGNRALAALFLVLAVVFVAIAIFYFLVRTSLLANSTAIHYKHAIIFLVLAVLALIAANFVRPKTALR
jgi:NADH:ubiquinone oxidoreductase subunit 6 (subunit J)